MFSKKPKIKSITSCSAGDFLFTFGLGKDGMVYIWNSIQCAWLPHKAVDPSEQQAGPAPITPPVPPKAK